MPIMVVSGSNAPRQFGRAAAKETLVRFAGMLALLGVGAISLAVGDPSTSALTPTAHAAAAPQTNQAAATPAAAPAKPAALDPEEKRLMAQGYRPEIRQGVKVYCRLEEPSGTRMGRVKRCGTVRQLKAQQAETRERVERMQRHAGG